MHPRFGAAVVTFVIALLSHLSIACGQIGEGPLPPTQYYLLYPAYYNGEYNQVFGDARTTPGVFRQGTDRFLDSACYWVLAGECQYQMGNYPSAMAFYEDALRLFANLQAAGWQNRLRPPNISNALPNALQRAGITWGQPKRAFEIPSLPDSINMMFGEMFSGELARLRGGVVDEARFRSVDVGEIMRCMGVALHRRSLIKGRVCEFDRLTSELLSQLEATPRNDGSLFGAWNGVLTGMAYSAAGEYDQARRNLEAGLQFGGRFDHQLTPLGLLHLALVAYRQGDLPTAAHYALEASYSAAIFQQFDVVEEALSLGTAIHLESKGSGVYPPLADAAAWAQRNRAQLPAISLKIRLAECLSESGDTAGSARLLTEASRAFSSRTGFGVGQLSGRANYIAASNQFVEGNFEAGMNQLQKALSEFASCSRWLYRLRWTEEAFLSRSLLPRHANTLFGLLLRDPNEREWRSDPIEAMTFLITPHLSSINLWQQIAIADRNYQQAIQISELYRRHWFYSTLPLGGREIAFRWTMHGPCEALTKSAEKQRQDFLTRYPKYREVSNEADRLRLNLLTRPLHHPPQSEEEKAYVQAFAEYGRLTLLQDSLLASIALRREPAEMVFPPQLDFDSVKLSLNPHQTVLYCIETNNQVFIFELTSLGIRLISTNSSRDVVNLVNKFFRESSLREKEMTPEMLQSKTWAKSSAEIAKLLIPGITLSGDEQTPHEVVIVPSGALWYLPFEALCLAVSDEKTELLMDRARVRYSPTVGLAVVPQRGPRQNSRTVFFVDKVSDLLDSSGVIKEFQANLAAGPGVVAYNDRLPIPSALFGAVCDEFVVWSGMGKMPSDGPYGLEIVQKDRGLKGSRLSNWLGLPWHGAEHIVLPFFESLGARGVTGNNAGDDLFLLTTSLLASGARTLMISRWTTGGVSGLQFSNIYWRENRKKAPMEAIHEARQKMLSEPIVFTREPRPAKPKGKEPLEITAQHPLFWAGYFLVDIPGTADPNQGIEDLLEEIIPAGQLQERPQDLPAVENPPPRLQGNPAQDPPQADSPPAEGKGKKSKTNPKKSKDKDKSPN